MDRHVEADQRSLVVERDVEAHIEIWSLGTSANGSIPNVIRSGGKFTSMLPALAETRALDAEPSGGDPTVKVT